MEGVSVDDKHKIVVAVDESEESMHALSWCLSNLVSHNSTTTLVLLYVKPPPVIYSSFDMAGIHYFLALLDLLFSCLARIYSNPRRKLFDCSAHIFGWCDCCHGKVWDRVGELSDETSRGRLQELQQKCKPSLFLLYACLFASFPSCLLNDGGSVQVNVEKVIGSGEAQDVICDTVEKLRPDTLVMGSHGYGFLKR